MKSFIQYEVRRLFTPAFMITTVVIYAIAGRLVLPPFMYKSIYQTESLLIIYEFIIQYAGFTIFYLFSISHFGRVMASQYRVELATRISGPQFLYGIFIIYFIFFTLGVVFPGYVSALLLQLVYAPGQIDWQVACSSIMSYPVFFQFALFTLSLPVFIRHISEYILLVIILLTQIVLFPGYRFMLSSVPILVDMPWLTSGIRYLLTTGSVVTVIWIASNLQNILLYTGDIKHFSKNLSAKILARMGLHISAIHIRIMGLSAQKLIFGISLFISAALAILNRMLNGQIIQLVDMFNVVIIPLLFASNQEDIFRPEKNLHDIDQLLVRHRAYVYILLSRFLILFTMQILCGLIAIGLTALFSHSYNLSYLIYFILFNMIFSQAIFIIHIYSNSQSLAIFSVLTMVYLQLNHATTQVFRDNILLKYFDINLLIHNPGIRLEMNRIILLVVSVICLMYFCQRVLRNKQYAVTGRPGV